MDELPTGGGWQFEPKWDGFRCLAFRDGDDVRLMSKSGKPLERFFPEVAQMLRRSGRNRFVLDGEMVVPVDRRLSFGALQARLHPAASRIARLSGETPAELVLFDCLFDGKDRRELPLAERRSILEKFYEAEGEVRLKLSPRTQDRYLACTWFDQTDALDGVIAKEIDAPYRPGERAMLKVKRVREADCVVGGFRYASGSKEVGSLLLGLYDEEGRLNRVGFTSGFAGEDVAELTARLESLVEPPGFTGKAPGGPSRWATERSSEWQPLRPELVVQVGYDQVTDDRFRHGTKLQRWRPDKRPDQCRMEQLEREPAPELLAAELNT
ncbi:ATP-dependent DNA ligase [Sphingomonas nostoxanthinifaciens]|uniref:ATP-dependent DNA ligase n=1 Tax=Sphingomonas nostoxanthinifaciens TaxID=2872652 RepID=UPI0021D89FCA|nr:ATP-dependent DNA ligase [Sphingomonas nostoxanthinifaciens]